MMGRFLRPRVKVNLDCALRSGAAATVIAGVDAGRSGEGLSAATTAALLIPAEVVPQPERLTGGPPAGPPSMSAAVWTKWPQGVRAASPAAREYGQALW